MIGPFRFGLKYKNRCTFLIHKRLKKTNVPKVNNSDKALEYFDIAYPPVYGTRWPSIRIGLLSKRKYVSIINTFAEYDKTVKHFEELGAVDIRPRYEKAVDLLKANTKTNKDSSLISGNENDVVDSDSKIPEKIRPSLIELTDDELAVQAYEKEISRYPEEYRKRFLAKDQTLNNAEIDLSSRVIPAAHAGIEEVLMMDYIPSTKLKGLENWIEETDVFLETSQNDQDIGVQREVQENYIEIPQALHIYAFLKGDITDFPHPKNDNVLQVQDHLPLDGGSLLPVLALDLQKGEHMLDMCAAPGGKSFIAIQTLLPDYLVCNDMSVSRSRRIENIIKRYIPKVFPEIRNLVSITVNNGCMLDAREEYDKVLVDVPCLNDRHSLIEDDNSIFSHKRVKERLRLPEVQSQLLVSALKAVRPGGIVVYSTCTLSPLQNDGAVHLALSRIWQETTIECSVVDMSKALQPLSFLYRFGNNLGLRYGHIVLPSLLNNFGPMYIAKIKRIK